MTTERPHGLSRYLADGCRCDVCVSTRRAYERGRRRRVAYGAPTLVDAAPARAHVVRLQQSGLGVIRIAELADVSVDVVRVLLYGRPARGLPPTQRLRPASARQLLAVRAGADQLADGALINAVGTVRRLRALVAMGWTLPQLANRIGMRRAQVTALIRQQKVTASTARRVRTVYDSMALELPPEDTTSRRAMATRSRNLARARGWAPPLAWEDDEIDDPAARPNRGTTLRSERIADVACVAELIAGRRPAGIVRAVDREAAVAQLTGAHLTAEQVAQRVGLSTRNVERIRARLAEAS